MDLDQQGFKRRQNNHGRVFRGFDWSLSPSVGQRSQNSSKNGQNTAFPAKPTKELK